MKTINAERANGGSSVNPNGRSWDRLATRLHEDHTVGRPHIGALALADPETSFSQEDVLGLLGLAGDEFAQRIFRRCGVERRQLNLTDEFLATTVQGRTPAIEEQLFEYAVSAVDQVGIDPAEIGVLVSATLYSLGAPTLAHRLVEHYAMDPSTDKYHLVGVGCASAVPLMRLASAALAECPGKKGLVVAAESMTGILTENSAADPRSKTVGSSIFGDGCAAAVIELDGASAHPRGPAIVASKVHQISGTLGDVRMQLAPDDSFLHLSRELPDVAGDGLGELVDDFLATVDLTRDEVDRWLVHPGGRRIIESVQNALSLSREDVQSSYEVLAEHGNVGTPSIFYVMKRALDRREPRRGERALMVTVGPGVTVGLMLLQW